MITLTIPNKDSMVGPYTVCPKEVMQQAWLDKVGTSIEWAHESHKILAVKITDEEVIVEIEGNTTSSHSHNEQGFSIRGKTSQSYMCLDCKNTFDVPVWRHNPGGTSDPECPLCESWNFKKLLLEGGKIG